MRHTLEKFIMLGAKVLIVVLVGVALAVVVCFFRRFQRIKKARRHGWKYLRVPTTTASTTATGGGGIAVQTVDNADGGVGALVGSCAIGDTGAAGLETAANARSPSAGVAVAAGGLRSLAGGPGAAVRAFSGFARTATAGQTETDCLVRVSSSDDDADDGDDDDESELSTDQPAMIQVETEMLNSRTVGAKLNRKFVEQETDEELLQ